MPTHQEKVSAKSPEIAPVSDTRSALEKMKDGLFQSDVIKKVGGELQNLIEEFKEGDLSGKEKVKKVVGLALFATLGGLLGFEKEEISEEDTSHFNEGRETYSEDENHSQQETEKAYEPLPEGKNDGFEEDGIVTKRQSAVNMHAIRYHEKGTGKVIQNPGGMAKKLKEKGVIPSKFILGKEGKLFKDGVGSLENFKKTVDKLVDESVTDPNERRRQASLILASCAVGRFQILPWLHFEKMDWKYEGDAGLEAQWKYIRSSERQYALYKKIIGPMWNKFKDPGLVGVAYYSGTGTARRLQKNPSDPLWDKPQRGGGTIRSYYEKAGRVFTGTKKEIPSVSELDAVAITIEKIESGGSFVKKLVKKKMQSKAA